jgi:hypothetical protein
MTPGLKMEEIVVGETYYFWVFIWVNDDNFTVQDLCECVAVKKGKKKVGVRIPRFEKIKWKYPNDLRK